MDKGENPSKKSDAAGRRTILLVNSSPILRKGMKHLLDSQHDLQVTHEAESSLAALSAVRAERFDLAIVDIALGDGGNGLELTKLLKAERPDLPVLVISIHDEALYAERSLRAGARGYITEGAPLASILHAVRSVIGGELFISRELNERMLADYLQGSGGRDGLGRLSDRELEVFQLISEGNDMHQIAAQLHVSRKTAEAHRHNITQKLGLGSARDLVRYATQWVARER